MILPQPIIWDPDHASISPALAQASTMRLDSMGRRCPGAAARGEDSGRARLTWEIVHRIRGPESGRSLGFLARKYSVGRSTIEAARKGRTWKEISS